MNTLKKLTGKSIAIAAASLFIAGTGATIATTAVAQEAQVHCLGVNGCKGTTACKTAGNACKGMNSCKGSGWLPMTKEECADKGGEVSE